MKVTLRKKLLPLNMILCLIGLVPIVTLHSGSYYDKAYMILGLALIFLMMSFKVEINEKAKMIVNIAAIILVPALSYRIVEVLNDGKFGKYNWVIHSLNLVWFYMLYFLVYLIVNKVKISYIISTILCYVVGVINHYLILFRGRSIFPSDLKSISTGISVLDQYTLTFNENFMLGAVFFIALIVFLVQFKPIDKPRKFLLKTKALGVIAAGFFTFLVVGTSFLKACGVNPVNWYGSRSNGFVLNFMVELTSYIVDEPSDYSLDKVVEITKNYDNTQQVFTNNETEEATSTDVDVNEEQENKDNQEQNTSNQVANTDNNLNDNQNETDKNKDKPNIIVIMDESYSDLSVLGNFNTNEDYMPYERSLTENTIKGNALASIYGAGTANSEYEFLTGNTLAFLPSGCIAYTSYIHTERPTLVSTLKDQGYTTYALHPFNRAGWDRPNVYKKFGFDDYFSEESFNDKKYLRNYLTDTTSFGKLKQLYENKDPDERLFLFNVTMQNHGGYTDKFDNFNQKIWLTDYSDEEFPATNQYLSLVKESDEAIKDLIDYFSKVDEPTLILLYGDHQPRIESEFVEKMLGKKIDDLSLEEQQKMYTVPFFLWANYDIPEQNVEITSLNYLSNLVLDTAGLEKTEYGKFLEEVQKQVPAINSVGYMDSTGVYHDVKNTFEHQYDIDLLNKYRLLQYNNMFDTKHTINSFFTIDNKTNKEK